MKPRFLLILLLICPPLAARAQVIVNPAALTQLAGISTAPQPAPAPVTPRPPNGRHITMRARILHPIPTVAMARPAPEPAAQPPPAAIEVAPISLAFAPGSAALSAGAASALKPFCQLHRDIGIDARAPPEADGVSGAMRLSLARALAVRDALIACGVAPENLLPRALGSTPGVDDNVTMISSGPQK